MQFVAIDVETANADMGSICQVGLAKFVDGKIAEEWCTLVDPEDYFDEVNIFIHGIEPRMVRGQPKLRIPANVTAESGDRDRLARSGPAQDWIVS